MRLFFEDLNRYFTLEGRPTLLKKAKIIILTQGIWAIAVYRFGSYIYGCKWNYILRKGLLLLATVLQKIIEMTCGISVAFSTRIGRGFYIGHFGGIFIHKDVKIGEYCNISQGVTIGLGGRKGSYGVPTIGNQVYIGPHAVIIGRISVGNNVAIGANAVVTHTVPDGAVVVGVPAKVISLKGSEDFVII